MTLQLRPYQQQTYASISAAWQQGSKNVLAVAPSGAGKTVLFGRAVADHNGAACAIAHRQELVGYKITPKGMLQIFLGQGIPGNALRQIFEETLH